MTSKKMYFLLVGVLVAIICSIMGVLYYSRVFITTSSDKLVEAKLKLYSLEETETTYRKNQKILSENTDISEIVQAVVPSEKDQARSVRELNIIAQDNDLKVASVIFPRSDLIATKKPVSSSSDEQATSEQSKTVSISQAKPVKGLNGVLGLEVSVEVSSPDGSRISTDQLLGFLRQVENNRRNMRITSINFSGDGASINTKLTLFIKP